MKRLCRILFTSFLLTIPFIVLANETLFSYTTKGAIPDRVYLGSEHSITYTITSKLGVSTPIDVSFTTLPAITDFKLTNNCKGSLAAGQSCTLIVDFQAKQLDKQSAKLIAKSGLFNIINTTTHTTVEKYGHLVFDQAGKVVTELNLGPNMSGTINLKNKGGSNITDLKVSDLTKSGFSNVDCPIDTGGTLAPEASCSFTYLTSATPTTASFTIAATGVGVDNSPHNLPVHVASTGHFVFEQAGKAVTELNLGPNAIGTINLKNTGGTTITKINVSDLSQTGFTNVNCPTTTGGTLAPGASCSFTYQIAAAPKTTNFVIIASGEDVDNTPTKLPVSIAAAGHFVFEQDGQPVTELNLQPKATGTVSLKNSGGSDISDLKVSDLTKPGFSNIDCPTDTGGSLAPGASCSFKYQIANSPEAASFTISATGMNVDNSPHTLPVHIASAGHFVFDKEGKTVSNLNLGPNATGTVSLKNTGGSEITDLKISDLTKTGFTNVDCPTDTGGSLAPGASCSFTYQIANRPPAVNFTVAASGVGVDNNLHALSVQVDSGMHVRVYNDWSGWEATNFDVHCNSEVKNIWTGRSAIFDNTVCAPLILNLGEPWPGTYKVDNTESAQLNCLSQNKERLVYSVGDNGGVTSYCEKG